MSERTYDVPWISAGSVQRARKTPATMASDTTMGEMPMFTSLVGASAPPSQAPAAKPLRMPTACRVRRRAEDGAAACCAPIFLLGDPAQDDQSRYQYDERDPEVLVAQDDAPPASANGIC